MISEPAQPLVRAIEARAPQISSAAFVAPGAVVVGDVELGAGSSVWYSCVLRADVERIVIGADCNIQDGCILHADAGEPTVLGKRVSLGHGAIVHAAIVEDDVLIGMRAVVLNGSRIGSGSLVAAGAVVRPGTQVPPNSFVAGVPAEIRTLDEDRVAEMIRHTTTEYRRLSRVHAKAWSE